MKNDELFKGIRLVKLYEFLTHNSEIEFEYNGVPYVIQPVAEEGKYYLVIWTAYDDKENICIAKEESFLKTATEKEVIDKVINTKCFEGKSLLEIHNDIEIIDIM